MRRSQEGTGGEWRILSVRTLMRGGRSRGEGLERLILGVRRMHPHVAVCVYAAELEGQLAGKRKQAKPIGPNALTPKKNSTN